MAGWDKDYYGTPMSDIYKSAMETKKYMEAWDTEKQQRENERAVSDILAQSGGDFDAADKMGIRQYLNPNQQMEWQKNLDLRVEKRQKKQWAKDFAASESSRLYPMPPADINAPDPLGAIDEVNANRQGFQSFGQNNPEVLAKAAAESFYAAPEKLEKPESPYKVAGGSVFDERTERFLTPPAQEKETPTEWKPMPRPVGGKELLYNPKDGSTLELGEAVQTDESGTIRSAIETKGEKKTEYIIKLDNEGKQVWKTRVAESVVPKQAGEDGTFTKGALSDLAITLRKMITPIRGIQAAKLKYKSDYLTYAQRGEGWMEKTLQKAQTNPESLTPDERGFFEFQSENMRNFNSYRSLITGAAAAMAEIEWLLESFPNGKMSREQYEAALSVIEAGLEDEYRLHKKSYDEKRPLEYEEIIGYTSQRAEERTMKRYGITEAQIGTVMAAGVDRETAITNLVRGAMEKKYAKPK